MTHELRSRIDAWFLEKNGFRLTDEELDRIISLCMEEAARCAEDETTGWFDYRAYVGQKIAARIRALATPEGQ